MVFGRSRYRRPAVVAPAVGGIRGPKPTPTTHQPSRRNAPLTDRENPCICLPAIGALRRGKGEGLDAGLIAPRMAPYGSPVKGDPRRALSGVQQPLAHSLTLEQMLSFKLAQNIPPKLDRQDDAGYLALVIRNVLHLGVIHGG